MLLTCLSPLTPQMSSVKLTKRLIKKKQLGQSLQRQNVQYFNEHQNFNVPEKQGTVYLEFLSKVMQDPYLKWVLGEILLSWLWI